MAGLTVQNFVSAGTGMAVAVAVIRGFVAAKGATLGNFWVDLTRSVLWILLSTALRAGQFVHVAAGEIVPADGEAVRGVASVNESAITGESAPVIREAGATGPASRVAPRLSRTGW